MREKLKRGVTSDVVKKIDVNESADQKKWVKNGPFSYRIVLGGPVELESGSETWTRRVVTWTEPVK